MSEIGHDRSPVLWVTGLAMAMAIAFAAAGYHADSLRSSRTARAAQRRAGVRLLGTADLFLSSSSRWIRHLSLSEPGAAFAEGPAMLDLDPAGGIAGPPVQLWAGFGSSLSVRRRP